MTETALADAPKPVTIVPPTLVDDQQTDAQPPVSTEPEQPAPAAAPAEVDQTWDKDQFCAWKERMGLKTNVEAAAALRTSDESTKGYSSGKQGRRVPAYIVLLCQMLETQKNAAATPAAPVAPPAPPPAPIVAYQPSAPLPEPGDTLPTWQAGEVIAEHYAEQLRVRRPLTGAMVSMKDITDDIRSALALGKLVVSLEKAPKRPH